MIRSDGRGIADFFSTVVLADEATNEAVLLFNALKMLTSSQPWENQDDTSDLGAVKSTVVKGVNGFSWFLVRHSIDDMVAMMLVM